MYQRYLLKKVNLKFDSLKDLRALNGTILKLKNTACLILGGGYIKHHIFNVNLMKNGANYCVVINTGEQYDCSDSGADIEEGITWGKVSSGNFHVKVHSEACSVMPILMKAVYL